MKFITQVSSLLFVVGSALAITVTYDNTYDNPSGSLATVACSSGPNGLLSRFPTFGSLPSFPNIGAAQVIAGSGSPNCGSCWQLAFNGTSINVLAIDHASVGYILSQAAMDHLTGGQAVALRRIDATAIQVSPALCGL